MKNKKRKFFSSVIALLLCLSMFVGTTFAWFTDGVTSGGNIIASGNLDATMEYATAPDGEWQDASEGSIFGYEFWEPGYTDMKFIRVGNNGNLAFRYQLHILPAEATPEGEAALADVIDVYCGIVEEGFVAPADFSENMPGMTKIGTLSELIGDEDGAAHGVLLPESGSANVELNPEDEAIAKTGSATVCILLHMQENAGNEYQDQTVGGNFEARLIATQYTYENDSFGNDYDKDSEYPLLPGNWEASAPVTVTNGTTSEAATVGAAGDRFSAAVPAGVKMAEGEEELSLKISTLLSGEANVTLEQGEKKTSLDVHMEGVAEDNTVPMVITLGKILPTGLNSTSVELYHVEDGVTVPMTQVATPVNHNEFSYDPATGTVVVALATFSEVTVVADTTNPWEGTAKTDWYNENDSEFTITNAEQLAGLGVLVDGGITFEDKTVKLVEDINLGGTICFDPIGWGYANADHNRDGIAGKTFNGTFDGQGHTIFNLYQSGWDLEASTGTGYTYTNCGFGLFAAASNATFKNLTISGADIRVECVEAGILVGLSQNGCTYDNIKIYNSKIANYQRPAGGLIGEVSGTGETNISNVTIGSDVVVGSLWGDFDCPVGGVIGARWDDASADPKINMENVTVSCKLDVYNDITSTYQWHAYRRAGMLIGNTDTPPANGKDSAIATADFLTCTNVKVCYGSWVNYHYCEFTNHNSSWPWVRVEEGENCDAFSNPRYGVPNDFDGNKVVDANHQHKPGDTCMEPIPFGQLYGGGQGVYGQETHNGVSITSYAYSITYMYHDEVLYIEYVEANSDGSVPQHNVYQGLDTATYGAYGENYEWVNAGSNAVTFIAANNDTDVVLHMDKADELVVRYLYQDGTVYKSYAFNNLTGKLENGETEPPVPEENGLEVVGWKAYTLKNATGDVTVYPEYKCNDWVKLTPEDSDGDGITDYYVVSSTTIDDENVDITIPEEVNGIKVTEIDGGAFTDGKLRDVYIPNSIKTIGKNAFTADSRWEYPQIQIIYDGTKAEWDAITKASGWDDNIGAGSVIVCTREDPIGHYLQDGSNGILGFGVSIDWKWIEGTPNWYPRET